MALRYEHNSTKYERRGRLYTVKTREKDIQRSYPSYAFSLSTTTTTNNSRLTWDLRTFDSPRWLLDYNNLEQMIRGSSEEEDPLDIDVIGLSITLLQSCIAILSHRQTSQLAQFTIRFQCVKTSLPWTIKDL